MKVIFMGTPDIAVTIMEAIIAAGHDIKAVVTQGDKPKGRGHEVKFPPVKEAALKHGIQVYQPERVKNNPELEESLKALKPDIIIVAAYGKLLPKSILELAPFGCVNVHASLLPKYRGAAPIQWAIIEGESVTGVTTMMMDEGLDTGDMLDKAEVRITPDDTAGTLKDKLAEAGGRLITETMEKLENGTSVRIKQDDSKSSYAKMLTKELGKLDFNKTAAELALLVRGLNPWPSAYAKLKGKTLKIWEAHVLSEKELLNSGLKEALDGFENGQVAVIGRDYLGIKTKEGVLAVTQLQLEGKKRMDARAFLSGVRLEAGESLI